MITVEMAIAWLSKCNPKAVLKLSFPDDDFIDPLESIQEVVDQNEVHFCALQTEDDAEDIEVITSDGCFRQIKSRPT